jgi:hypothetical protein
MASKSETIEELKSLKEELSTHRAARKSWDAAPSAAVGDERGGPASTAPGPSAGPDGAAGGEKLRHEIGDLMNEAVRFLEDQESDTAPHPVAIAIGGLVVGLIVGLMLRRR